jgi:hypothetical protein
MKKDRFEDAKPVHTDHELEQKTQTDNYYWLKNFKAGTLPVAILFLYFLAFIFAAILVGFVMYLFGCPLIRPETGVRLQEIVKGVLLWGFGMICHYGFNQWRDSGK